VHREPAAIDGIAGAGGDRNHIAERGYHGDAG